MDYITVFEKFGLPVAFLLIMIWLYVKSDERASHERKEHGNERREWRTSQEQLQKDTNKAIGELTDAIKRSNHN